MSLLLDALKKAAEQKAKKSKEDIPGAETSDETIVVSAPEDISELEDTDRNLQKSQRDMQDQTEFDESRLQTQVEDTHVERDDETIVETADTQLTDLSTQMQTGEDETIVFAEEDVSDFMGEPELVRREAEDVTELSQVTTSEDRTEVQTHIEPEDEPPVGEDTEFDQTALQTQLESTQIEADRDETEFDQTLHQTNVQADDAESTRAEVEDDLTELQEDMSLLLVERDDTHFTSHTSLTDPRQQTEQIPGDATETDGLGLMDTTRHQPPPGEATQTKSATQTGVTGTALDTQSTATRTDSTGTYTYAPDNYDRTLMKLPSDDASRLFAGMKNDSEAVMTPDYAKKVFRSKSSAQRMHNAKIYTGIAIVIILAIGIFGAFEFQFESDQIDTSLRPLKRDPMPGLIKSGSQDQDSNLFAQPEPSVDTRAMEIIESAESTTDTGEVAVGSEEIEAAIEPEAVITEPEPEVAYVSPEQVQVQPQMDQATNTEVASIDQAETPAKEPEGAVSNLQISLSSQVGQKDIWLREAYAAYKSGNDELAMTRYNQVLDIDPGNRNALLARAAINVQNGNSRAAFEDYQALLLANPKDSLAMASLISVANYSPLETESQLKLMLRDEPGSPHLNFTLANVYGAQNRWQEAQGYYFRALQSNPGDPNYAYNLAVSLEHISQPASAITYYRRALDNFENGPATFSRDVVDQRLELLAKQ
ncbi:MAG: tetratricopeptide repeat protein [Gammaproteobacteria bacterium]|nr:tetratricopeptide repeat protein [Gammaproteobacteria bacterium]MDH3856711.1 tetratricopeptide repeat protein [Gammaproteobacteria bacterium]